MLRHISKLFLFLSFIPIIYSYNNTTCIVCNDIVDIIQEEIKFSNSSIDIIEKAINATCHLIPIKPEKEECMTILDDISLIVKWFNRWIISKTNLSKTTFMLTKIYILFSI